MTARIRAAQITGLNVKLLLDFIQATRSWIEEDLITALLVAGVLSANVEPAQQQPEELRRYAEPGGLPDDVRRPVNAMSVALSLGIARETARIKLCALLERGLLERRDGGVVLSNQVITTAPFLGAMQSFVKAISDFIDGLAALDACGVLAGDTMADPPYPVAGVAARLATTHVLRGIDYARETDPALSLTTHYILLSLSHLTQAALRLPADALEDSGRPMDGSPKIGPVSVAQLAKFTRLPDETVRRQIVRLETLGVIVRCRGGCEMDFSNPERVQRWNDFQNRTTVSTRQVVWKLFCAGVIVRGKAHGLTLNMLER